MAPFPSLEKIKILSTSFLFLGQLVLGSPAALQGRAACNEDNCLREMQHTSELASPFCSSYLGATSAG
jgi:hypothetical protein